jgi:hypothetical protein
MIWRWLVDTPAARSPVIVSFLPPLVALLALVVAWRTAIWVARQKATIDLIEKSESTTVYRENSVRFSELRRGPGFLHLADPQSDGDRRDRRHVLDHLNHYELVALGIRRGVLSSGFYKRWMGGPFVRDWNAALDFIEVERWKCAPGEAERYDPKVFQNFERIARRWSPRDARPPLGVGGRRPAVLAGPGAELLPELAGVDPAEPAAS